MQTSLLKKLTLLVVIASTCAITGCNDANSKNPVPSQNNAQHVDTAPTSATNTQSGEEEKRNAESGSALY